MTSARPSKQQHLKPTTKTSGVHFSRRDRSNKDILSLTSSKDESTNNYLKLEDKPNVTNRIVLGSRLKYDKLSDSIYSKTESEFSSQLPKLKLNERAKSRDIIVTKIKGNKHVGDKVVQFSEQNQMTAKSNVARNRTQSIRLRSIAEARAVEKIKDLNRWKREGNIEHQSYSHMQKEFEKMVDRLHSTHKLDKTLVRNICTYLKMLPKFRSNFVDENIFKACLYFRLNMVVKSHMLSDLFSVLRREHWDVRLDRRTGVLKTDGQLPLEAFCSFVCLLITDDSKTKANIIFSMFDYKSLGFITLRDLDFILTPLINNDIRVGFEETDITDNEDKSDEVLHGLSSMVMRMMDIDGDGDITRLEFETKAVENKNFLNTLGMTLPDSHDMVSFINMLKDRTIFDINEKFRDERNTLLRNHNNDSNAGFIQSFYPVDLDML